MNIVTKEGITVRVGQVWRDLDPRMTRTVTVEGIDTINGKAIVRGAVLSRISIKRMHRHCTGWELVSEPQP